MNRREVIKFAVSGIFFCFSRYITGYNGTEAEDIKLAQLIYRGGNWKPRPDALKTLSWEIKKRTSVNISIDPVAVNLLSKELFFYPFLYINGDRGFSPFSDKERSQLLRYLNAGGFVFIDTALTGDGNGKEFIASIYRELSRMGINKLREIKSYEVVYRSFYKLKKVNGRREGKLKGWINPYNYYGIIVSDMDIGGAWCKDLFGNWKYDVEGGEPSRYNAIKTGVNIVMYALCLDYKNEKPHLPFLTDE